MPSGDFFRPIPIPEASSGAIALLGGILLFATFMLGPLESRSQTAK